MKAKEVKCERCGGNGRLSTPITKGAPEGGSMECRACNGMGRVEAKEADDLKEAASTIESLSTKLAEAIERADSNLSSAHRFGFENAQLRLELAQARRANSGKAPE